MLIRPQLPDLPAGGRVQAIDIPRGVAEERHRPAARFGHGDAGTHLGLDDGGPMDATRGGIERVDTAVLAPGEDPPPIDGRLRPQDRGVGEGEDPFGHEPRQIIRRQAGIGGRLEARVREARSPTRPVRTGGPWGAGRARVGDLLPPPFHSNGGAEKVCDRHAFVGGKGRPLLLHHTALERFENGAGRHGLQRRPLRNAWSGLGSGIMTGSAMFLEQGRGVRILRGVPHERSKQE